MAASVDPAQTSPKVKAIDKWGSIGALGLGVLAFFLSALTPELFVFLGPWAGIVTATLVFAGVGISRLAAYQALDPLRQNTAYQHELLTKGPGALSTPPGPPNPPNPEWNKPVG